VFSRTVADGEERHLSDKPAAGGEIPTGDTPGRGALALGRSWGMPCLRIGSRWVHFAKNGTEGDPYAVQGRWPVNRGVIDVRGERLTGGPGRSSGVKSVT